MRTIHLDSNAGPAKPSTPSTPPPKTRLPVHAAVSWLLVAFAACALAGSAAARTLSNTGPALVAGDAEILGTYIQVNGFDVETALLGRAQASSNAVRDLAARVSNDHLGVRQAAFDLAARCQVTPVLVSSRLAAANEHGRTMANLLTLTGSEFDHAYVQHEVAFHRAAIDAVRNVLLPAATCPALKTHFKDVLPAFAKHLAETEALAGQLTAR